MARLDTGPDAGQTVIPPERLLRARMVRMNRRTLANLCSITRSALDMKASLDDIGQLLANQHDSFQDALERNRQILDFCARCDAIMDCGNAERMERERDWLLAGYKKRNAHRRDWLGRLGLLAGRRGG